VDIEEDRESWRTPTHLLLDRLTAERLTAERDAAQLALADHLHECAGCEDRTCTHRSHADEKWCNGCGIWIASTGMTCGSGMLRGAQW